MIAQTKPLNQISKEAIFTLSSEIGSANTVRFLTQFTTGFGDYTKDRCNFLGNDTIDETLSAMKEMKKTYSNKKIHSDQKK